MKFYTRQNDSAATGAFDAAEAAENLYRQKRGESMGCGCGKNQDSGQDCHRHKGHCPPPCSESEPPQWGCHSPGVFPPSCGCPPQWGCGFPPQPWWGCQYPPFFCPPQPQCCCVPGPQGARGPRGFRGPKGRPGDPSPGAVIPFSSGNTQVILTTVVGALPGTGLMAAVGASDTLNGIVAGAGGELVLPEGNLAFSLPRDAVITAINVFFTNTLPLTLCGSVLRITAQLYYSAAPGNVFLPLAGTRVDLSPTLSGNVSANNIFTGSAQNLNVNVSRGTRLLLVFSLSVISGPSLNVTLTGTASAGVNLL